MEIAVTESCTDADGDGYGVGVGCIAADCNDSNATVHPDATEITGDGIDSDCNGGEVCFVDADGDGARTDATVISADADCADAGEAVATAPTGDCDDALAVIKPGAIEITGNGVDENCDGVETCFSDTDGDGFRGATTIDSTDADCTDAQEALASAALDCDDDDADINADITEIVADGIDQDCDGADLCYVNADNDGFRTEALISAPDLDCTDPGEAVAALPIGDCDDAADTIFPGATEVIGDGVDQDCDTHEACHVDEDGDGARTEAVLISDDLDCNDPGEAAPSALVDCADLPTADPNCGNGNGNACSPLILVDDCNGGIDNDCDVSIDEDIQLAWYDDTDGDGFGADATSTLSCTQPSGFIAQGGDCDDDDESVWALQPRYTDQDSDGSGTGEVVQACEGDSTALGFAVVDGDCDDSDATVRIGAAELPDDGVDQDCVGGDLVMGNATGIFVSPTGDDDNAGTMAAPVATIFAGDLKAGPSQVLFIADGTYTYGTVGPTLERSMFGGYTTNFSSRNDGSGTIVNLNGAVRASTTAVALERLELRTEDTQSPFAVGVSVPEGGNVTLREVTVVTDGSFSSTAVNAMSATVVIESSDLRVGDALLCTSISSRGGRLVVARSHLQSCASQNMGGGSSVGIVVTRSSTTDNPGYAAIVGNVIETDPVGGTSTSVAMTLYGTRTRVLVANNTLHLGPSVEGSTPSPARFGIDVSSEEEYVTHVVALNNLITAASGTRPAAGITTGAPFNGYVVLGNNDIFLEGAGDCAVQHNGACITNADAFSCNFGGCIESIGNFATDPQYTTAFHIDNDSACVDTGLDLTSRAPVGLLGTDIDGDARSLTSLDVGADEYAD